MRCWSSGCSPARPPPSSPSNLVGAIATAGRVDGGSFHLGVGPTMLVAMLFLVWAGPGVLAVDRMLLLRAAA